MKCRDCREAEAEVFISPNDQRPINRGRCQQCYERAIRDRPGYYRGSTSTMRGEESASSDIAAMRGVFEEWEEEFN